MEKETFKKQLTEQMKDLKIEINEKQAEQFYYYMNLLLEWNEKINLTAITKPEEIIQKHFVDSATIIKYLENTKTVVDIGTGAGFPGIPIKIIKPEIEILLVDSLNKRIKFLEEIIKQLKLEKIQAKHARAEELGQDKNYREQYDAVVTRAVANMRVLSEYTIPLIKKGGKAIYMKGPQIKEELEEAKNAIKILGGEIQKQETLKLPKSEIIRNNIIIHKKSTTSGKYPRKTSQIKKYKI